MKKQRCAWVTEDPLYIQYHDTEWGRPSYEDTHLFEMLTLEGAQAGLSWLTILKRRENYRHAFANFNIDIVSQYDERDVQSLLQNAGIIRNQLKIRSVITNAQAILKIQAEYGDFRAYMWQFMNGTPHQNNWHTAEDVPAHTKTSEKMSKDLKKGGFKFVGPTICYAFMQATGMVNDHTRDCFLGNMHGVS